MPDGLVSVRISPQTGHLADALDPDAIFETFMLQNVPQAGAGPAGDDERQGATSSDPLF